MPYNFDADLKGYFKPNNINLPDYHQGGEIHPCDVEPIIDGFMYFERLKNDINALQTTQGVKKIYIASWYFESSFNYGFGDSLFNVLINASMNGVEVKILIWVSDYLFDNSSKTLFDLIGQIPPHNNIQFDNLAEIKKFRTQITNIKNQGNTITCEVMANVLDYPSGACHSKFIFIQNEAEGICYTGGMDFHSSRYSHMRHHNSPQWHDIQLRITNGAVLRDFYNYFKLLWDSNRSRPVIEFLTLRVDENNNIVSKLKHKSRTEYETLVPELDNSVFTNTDNPNFKGQSLRTLPDYSDSFLFLDEQSIPGFENGKFEIELALKTAIGNAHTYIYIEDQAFWSSRLFDCLVEKIRNTPEIRLILVTAPDPGDGLDAKINTKSCIYTYLLRVLTLSQRARVLVISKPWAIHSKLWIIDDVWALAGSANFMNRSLDFEIEHSFGFSDLRDNDDNVIKNLRVILWSEHAGLDNRFDIFGDINIALNVLWGDYSDFQGQPDILTEIRLTALPNLTQMVFGSDASILERYQDTASDVTSIFDSRYPLNFKLIKAKISKKISNALP